MEYTIKKDVLYTCDKYGNTGHRIAEGVSNAHYSESKELFLVIMLNGLVELKDKNGNKRSSISENAKDARFDGDKFIVRLNDGTTRSVDKYGNKGAFL